MDRIDDDIVDLETVNPWWLRYIDDIFFICKEGEDKIEGYLNRLNNFRPNLKFKHKNTSVNFLDESVCVVDNKLEADLFCKPTDCQQYLHFNSDHAFHNKKNCLQPGTAYQKAFH